ncbi:hypothetical protein [Spirosoma utsteinense]|uniref:PLAT domain-containing protein n=1 Tax=Spirosoma utsteinense TaxID=2585773 RepID=A0ABR6WBV0_9BACT|nr:hypothetical protein [Spirosoma utsteinense]MBC3784202.1 hypothetical protein [Spirosoma utsteinense]MBC3794012.1 hypothetical protein [Spirosoma utsteinense]
MKKVLSILALFLIALSGFAQPAKYSFEEVSYSPGEQEKYVTVYSSDIVDVNGTPKYTLKVIIDVKNNKLKEHSGLYLEETGKTGSKCMSTVKHISHLYLGSPNTGGVEAYAHSSFGTNVVVYFLAGATTSDTFKFLIYAPSGPTNIKL